MKALLDKTHLRFNGVITPELKRELETYWIVEVEGMPGTFIIPADFSYYRQVKEILKCSFVLLVNNIEDLYYAPSYHILVDSDAKPNLLALINSLHAQMNEGRHINILKQAANLRLLADMIDAYNSPVTLY